MVFRVKAEPWSDIQQKALAMTFHVLYSTTGISLRNKTRTVNFRNNVNKLIALLIAKIEGGVIGEIDWYSTLLKTLNAFSSLICTTQDKGSFKTTFNYDYEMSKIDSVKNLLEKAYPLLDLAAAPYPPRKPHATAFTEALAVRGKHCLNFKAFSANRMVWSHHTVGSDFGNIVLCQYM